MDPGVLLLVLVSSLAGAAIGTVTGLVPGIHVNLAASLLAASSGTAASLFAWADPGQIPLLVSCCIFSAATVHSFVSFVPSAFIGAPDPDDALSVLPAHRLLSEGRGMVAVRASAVGSVVGAASAIILAIPLQAVMLAGAAKYLDGLTLAILGTAILLLVLSSRRPLVTAGIVLVSGIMGYAVMNIRIPSSGLLGESTLLFPMLTGMFGLPPLMEKHSSIRARRQFDDGIDPVGPAPGIRGVAVGLVTGWFPGITATVGATIASSLGKESKPESFIALASSIGTVTSVFALVTLSVTGHGRSGTAVAVKGIIGDSLGGFCSEAFCAILIAMAVAAAVGYAATILSGRGMMNVYDSVPTDVLSNAVLILITALVFLMTGPFGLMVLVVCTALGMVPPAAGVSRSALAACLIIPAMLNCAGIAVSLPSL